MPESVIAPTVIRLVDTRPQRLALTPPNWFVATRLRAHVEKSISLELIPKSAVA